MRQNVAAGHHYLSRKCFDPSYMHESPTLACHLHTKVIRKHPNMSVKTKVLYVVLGLAMLAEAGLIFHFYRDGISVIASAGWGSLDPNPPYWGPETFTN